MHGVGLNCTFLLFTVQSYKVILCAWFFLPFEHILISNVQNIVRDSKQTVDFYTEEPQVGGESSMQARGDVPVIIIYSSYQ